MPRLNLTNKKSNSYCPPEKPSTTEKIVDKLWDVIHITIIPNMIMQDDKIETVKGQNKWQMVFLGLILTALSVIIGLCLSGRLQV